MSIAGCSPLPPADPEPPASRRALGALQCDPCKLRIQATQEIPQAETTAGSTGPMPAEPRRPDRTGRRPLHLGWFPKPDFLGHRPPFQRFSWCSTPWDPRLEFLTDPPFGLPRPVGQGAMPQSASGLHEHLHDLVGGLPPPRLSGNRGASMCRLCVRARAENRRKQVRERSSILPRAKEGLPP